MRSDTAQHSRIGRRRLSLALAGVACCAASLLPAITTAQARTAGHAGPAWSWSAPTAQHHGHGSAGGGFGPEAAGPRSGSPASNSTAGAGDPQARGQGEAEHGGAAQGSGQTSGPPETQQGSQGNHGWHSGGSGGHGGGQAEAGQTDQPGHGDGPSSTVGSQQVGSQQGDPHSGHQGGPGDSAQPQDTSPAGTAQGSPSQQAAPSSGQTPTATAASPVSATPSTSTPAGVSPGSTTSTTAAASDGASKKPKAGRRPARGKTSPRKTSPKASRSRAGRRGSSRPAGALALAGKDARGGTASTAHRAAAHHPGAKQRSSQASHLPPVVRTITKIVSVVPLPLRILIGCLVAMAIGLAVRSRLAAARAKRLEQQRSSLLEDVGLLQAALLPGSPQRLGAVGTSTAYRPASGPAAGGDFYDLFALEDGRLAAIVGDISGHGRQALPHTALTRFTLRAYLEAGFSPREALQTAGVALERQLGDSFATVALATYQPRDRTLTYACAGHPQPIVLGPEPLATVTAASAPPIGAGMQTGTRQTVLLLPGAAEVCMHTDGITDARVGGDLYGMQRLTRALRDLGPGASASDLLDRVAAQTDAQPDDMAACLLHISGGSEAPRVLAEQLQLDAEQAHSARAEQFLLACGVQPGQVSEILGAARQEALRGGSALLEVQPDHGAGEPKVIVKPNNVAAIHAEKVRRELAGAR